MAIPNQANYQDEQNFNIDIDKIYSDFIGPIDAIRSYNNANNISGRLASSIFSSGDLTLAKLKAQASLCTTLQESRCHAFYRIIGFPVVSSDNSSIYNPGFDIVYDGTRKAGISDKKLSIAAKQIAGFRDLSIQREQFTSSMSAIFGLTNSIDASVLALSSSIIRKFVTPLDLDATPFDMKVSNQQHKVDFTSKVGSFTKSLSQYVDVNGNTPGALQTTRTHIIKPFMVDPVIDFTVNDASRLVAVPFVPNKSYLMVKDNVFVNRPIIEQIIRNRFTVGNAEDTVGSATQSTIDYIKSIKSIQNEKIISQVTGPGSLYKLSEQAQFVNFIQIITAMMILLVAALKTIKEAQELYYWVPLPSPTGPEFGSSVQGVFISKNIPSDFITPTDQDIINVKIKTILNQINAQTSSVTGAPDLGGFSFDNFKTTFGSDTSSSLGDISAKTLQKLTDARTNNLQKAGTALQTVEIIMGEFSGLGLCDIIATMGALYVMPKNDILGFLDADAFDRMESELQTGASNPGISTAITSLTSTVKDFYNITDDIYKDLSKNNK